MKIDLTGYAPLMYATNENWLVLAPAHLHDELAHYGPVAAHSWENIFMVEMDEPKVWYISRYGKWHFIERTPELERSLNILGFPYIEPA